MDDDPQCYSLTNCFGFFSKNCFAMGTTKEKVFSIVFCHVFLFGYFHSFLKKNNFTITLFFSLLLWYDVQKYATIKTSGLGLIQGLWIWV